MSELIETVSHFDFNDKHYWEIAAIGAVLYFVLSMTWLYKPINFLTSPLGLILIEGDTPTNKHPTIIGKVLFSLIFLCVMYVLLKIFKD
jgi:hypothetical protein